MLLGGSKEHQLKMEKGSWGDTWWVCPDGRVHEGAGRLLPFGEHVMHKSSRTMPDPTPVLTLALPGGQCCHFTVNELSHGQIASHGCSSTCP